MNKNEDYASDADGTDEDFCPENAGESDVGSEVESEEEAEDSDEENEAKEKAAKKPHKNLSAEKINKATEVEDSNRRSTRTTVGEKVERANREKDELESDEEDDKTRSDVLWADFLGDAKVEKRTNKLTDAEKNSSSNGCKVNAKETTEAQVVPSRNKKVTVTEVLDFAGEEVRVQKTVNEDSVQACAKPTTTKAGNAPATRLGLFNLKRPGVGVGHGAGGGGIGSILNTIGKKKKLSVLEKSKVDWNSFKQDEGIEEELQTFNKGRDGFLERQDFLERTDLRQFEIEKGMRQAKRHN